MVSMSANITAKIANAVAVVQNCVFRETPFAEKNLKFSLNEFKPITKMVMIVINSNPLLSNLVNLTLAEMRLFEMKDKASKMKIQI